MDGLQVAVGQVGRHLAHKHTVHFPFNLYSVLNRSRNKNRQITMVKTCNESIVVTPTFTGIH